MALIKCKECGTEVSDKADKCPNCGAPIKKGIDCLPGCLIIFIVLIVIGFIGSLAEGPTKRSAISTPSLQAKNKWYEGGTLHDANAAEWNASTPRNRLATTADFLANAKVAKDMAELRVRSFAVEKCITIAVSELSEPTASSQPVSGIAALCTVTLGYK